MDLRSVVKKAAELIEASVEEEAHAFFVTVGVSESEDEDEDDRTQLVMVELDEEGELVAVSTDVGPASDDHDYPEVLRLMRDAVFSRVYVSEGTEDEPEQVVVEASLIAERLDAELLSNVLQEVAEVADEIEVLLFDEDEGPSEEDEEDDDEVE
jgi:hypothetical protein